MRMLCMYDASNGVIFCCCFTNFVVFFFVITFALFLKPPQTHIMYYAIEQIDDCHCVETCVSRNTKSKANTMASVSDIEMKIK